MRFQIFCSSVDGEHLMRFQIFCSSVDGEHLMRFRISPKGPKKFPFTRLTESQHVP